MRSSIALLLLAFGAGCASDYSLRPGEPAWADDDDDAGDDDDSVPRLPPPPPPPPSPWGNLDPGELPDVRFVVAWNEWDCNRGDIDGRTEPVEDFWMPCPARYAVVDLRGQVLLELSPPDPWPDDPWSYAYAHMELMPAGPGRFVALMENWYGGDVLEDHDEADGPDSGEDDGAADGLDSYEPGARDGIWAGGPWELWSFDAVAQTSERLARWDQQNARVQFADDKHVFSFPEGQTPYSLHVASWPGSEDLLFWGGGYNVCGSPEQRPLFRVDPRERSVRALAFDDLAWLPADADGDALRNPISLQSGVDDEGRPVALFATSGVECDGTLSQAELWSWPGDGPAESLGSFDLAYGAHRMEFAGHLGGGAFRTDYVWTDEDGDGVEDTWRERWTVSTPTRSFEGELPPDRVEAQAGILLDPSHPTFAMLARDDTTWRPVLDFIHGGERVWSIDRLIFGLEARDVYISDVMALPMPEQP